MDVGKISLSIVRKIVRDVHSRYGLEKEFRNTPPEIQIQMYEKWMSLVSNELEKYNIVDESYDPLDIDSTDFVDIVDRVNHYHKNEDDL